MDVDLALDSARFRTRLNVRRRDGSASSPDLMLDGVDLGLISVRVDGATLGADYFNYDGRRLTVRGVGGAAVVEVCNTAPAPRHNKSAMGLCSSEDGEIYTQCEAEGFRLFTFGIDRPDVLSTYDVTLRANSEELPALLSNGHKIASGLLADGRHWARWQDPGPKPTYLFAILAGRFDEVRRTYETSEGRLVEIGLYANARYIESCQQTLDWVVRAMRWDETVFGRAYDLGRFNVGVLNGFAGAMENKGLNLFDLAWMAAGDENATDEDFEYRMKSVAHEYFHHWSGDRVTIRNWFEVSLKEGLTRFRDQLFLGDQTEFTSVRIRMARHMRANQFTEDDSAVAHPPILDSYVETRNVYTNTTYDKGQEIIFMLLAMLGRDEFSRVVSAYFDRYVDQAVTIEEFLDTFETVGGLDLRQFRLWYYQAGLTTVAVEPRYDPKTRRFAVTLTQSTRPTSGEPVKRPHHIPLSVGLLAADGRELSTRLEGESGANKGSRVLTLRANQETFLFEDVPERPVLSTLRGFSAPIRLVDEASDEDLAVLVRHDSDLFARWDAGQTYSGRIIHRYAAAAGDAPPGLIPEAFLDAFTSSLRGSTISPRVVADLMTLPDERTLGEVTDPIDVDGVHAGREAISKAIAVFAEEDLWRAVTDGLAAEDRDRGNDAVGRRRLLAVALEHLSRLDDRGALARCLKLVKSSANFSNQVAALAILAERGGVECEEALEVFRTRHASDHLAMDRWYCVQAAAARSDTADRLDRLMDAPEFTPIFSRLFSLCDVFFYRNRYGLNAPGGRGYEVFARQLLKIDQRVPMIAGWAMARSDLTRWRKFDPVRQEQMRSAIAVMLNAPTASTGLMELCGQALA